MATATSNARHGIRVRGTVQGVGFRPTVYRLAGELGLGGLVRNDAQGVWIEIEGRPDLLARFEARLPADAPPLAHIEALEIVDLAPAGDVAFSVGRSGARDDVRTLVPADAATCDACLAELFDSGDRRFRYPFINCTACGPRYTIVRDVPYDRARTTMDAFTMCAACRAEYDDPRDRRFHAEANGCAVCGPHVSLRGDGAARDGEAALAGAIAALAAGQIVAVKGLGGFHLAVDAGNETAVARLRVRKQRMRRPLALMARDLATAEALVVLDAPARAALRSPMRPIVLAPRRPDAAVAPSVAPGVDDLGVMLPYTPLHHLLFEGGPEVLVMTSGNRAEEPIARNNDEARVRLAGIADLFLVHDRAIHSRADDSVVRSVAGVVQPVRRSRGAIPEAIALGLGADAADAPSILAVGAELKDTVCLTRGDHAVLSPHVGDLDNAETHETFVELITKLGRLLDVTPEIIAHDLHPDYRSTRWAIAQRRAREPVQHHHAHIASCLVDNARNEPVIGVAFDGAGCGPEGDAWGGEFLVCDLARFTRIAHLGAIGLPGGEAAIREPWRLALAALVDAGLPLAKLAHIPPLRRAAVAGLVERAPRATGAGRWFDAVAALCRVCDVASYDGQAAVELEALARRAEGDLHPYPYEQLDVDGEGELFDLRPMVRALCAELDDDVPPARAAARFHATLAAVVVDGARRCRSRTGLECVALSGGCFQNRILTETCKEWLEADGFEVLIHHRVPPNDGGVALGQAAVAAHRWLRRRRRDDERG